jgi:two-component system LytT family sensor kinase
MGSTLASVTATLAVLAGATLLVRAVRSREVVGTPADQATYRTLRAVSLASPPLVTARRPAGRRAPIANSTSVRSGPRYWPSR